MTMLGCPLFQIQNFLLKCWSDPMSDIRPSKAFVECEIIRLFKDFMEDFSNITDAY